MTVIMHITDFVLEIKNVTDSNIGPVNVKFLSEMLHLLEPALTGIINLAFRKGIDMRNILHWLNINFIEFEATLLKPMNGYFIFYITPGFNLKYMDDFLHDIGNFLFDEFVLGEDLQ